MPCDRRRLVSVIENFLRGLGSLGVADVVDSHGGRVVSLIELLSDVDLTVAGVLPCQSALGVSD